MKNGWTWSRSVVPVAFLTNAGVRNIIFIQVTFIIRFGDWEKWPVRSRNRSILPVQEYRRSYSYLLMIRFHVHQWRTYLLWTALQKPPSGSRFMAFRLRSPMLQPVRRSSIHCRRYRGYVRWPVRCVKNFPDHRTNRHEKEFWRSYDDHPWCLWAWPLCECSLSVLWKGQPEIKSSPFW